MDWLFDADAFFRRSHCGDWPLWFRHYYGWANLLIAAEYFLIPLMITILGVSKRHLFGKPWLTWFWIAFIFCCGVTHVNEVLTFAWPAYRWFATWDWITALAGLPVIITAPYVITELMKGPTAEQIALDAVKLEEALEKVQSMRDILDGELSLQLKEQLKLSVLVNEIMASVKEMTPDVKEEPKSSRRHTN